MGPGSEPGHGEQQGPYPIQEIWARYANQIPESYRTLTIGQLLARYPE